MGNSTPQIVLYHNLNSFGIAIGDQDGTIMIHFSNLQGHPDVRLKSAYVRVANYMNLKPATENIHLFSVNADDQRS